MAKRKVKRAAVRKRADAPVSTNEMLKSLGNVNKGVAVVAVQASKIEQEKLNQWINKYNIPFPVGKINGDVEKIRFNWGVKSLPWLILTDKQHVVQSEGLGVEEVVDKIKNIKQ